jgi:3-hydroxybutyryl-CoA dehydratase
MPEATPEIKQRLQEAFDEMHVRQTFTFRRTFTDGDVAMFCGVTGDYNPYHQDEAFARESPHGRLTIPGLLTGSMLTHIGGLLGFLVTEMSFEYLAPVFVGDSVSCTVTVVEKDEVNVGSRRAPASSIRTASKCSGRGSRDFLVAPAWHAERGGEYSPPLSAGCLFRVPLFFCEPSSERCSSRSRRRRGLGPCPRRRGSCRVRRRRRGGWGCGP